MVEGTSSQWEKRKEPEKGEAAEPIEEVAPEEAKEDGLFRAVDP